jgi:hypothetical protein
MNPPHYSMAAGLKFPPLAEKQEKLLLRFGTQCRLSPVAAGSTGPARYEAGFPREIRHGLPGPTALLRMA